MIFVLLHPAIHTKSAGTAIRNNLISLNIWPGTYNGRSESQNIYYDGSVDAVGVADTVLQVSHQRASPTHIYICVCVCVIYVTVTVFMGTGFCKLYNILIDNCKLCKIIKKLYNCYS